MKALARKRLEAAYLETDLMIKAVAYVTPLCRLRADFALEVGHLTSRF